MNWNIQELQDKIKNISDDLQTTDETFKETIENISEQDITKESYDVLYSTMTEDEKEYHRVNEKYKEYISRFSKSYIEMSEFYYGPELPYEIYKKHFKKDTPYLDSKKGIEDMYGLFIFYMIAEATMNNVLGGGK